MPPAWFQPLPGLALVVLLMNGAYRLFKRSAAASN
jgi:hypothetical protein